MPNPRVAAKDSPLRLTRRGLFAGSASLAATALAPAALALPTQDDAKLTALGAKFEQALGLFQTAETHFNACERRYLAECPDPPEALTYRGLLAHWLKYDWMYWSSRELRAVLRNPDHEADWPAAQSTLRIALAYEARERRFKRRTGLRAAERAYRAAGDALDALGHEMLSAHARSCVGLAVKGRAVKAWGKPEWWSRGEGHADSCERFAAALTDEMIAAAS
jgi:hypothetical protein